MGKDSKKHSKEKDRGERSKKDHKHKSKHDKKNKDEKRRSVAVITEDDFFHKSEEFRVWLKISKSVFFEDLTSDDARRIFVKEFVKDYNKGKLSDMYYDGNIPLEVRSTAVKSQHRWAFKLSKNEEIQLADLTEDVDHETRAPAHADSKINATSAGPSALYCRPSSTAAAQPSGTSAGASDSRLRADNEWDKQKDKYAQQRMQLKVTTGKLAEELLPGKETGGSREQRRDQKKAVGESLHGAHRDKEEGRDGLAVPEKTLLGGDSREEYNRMRERERMQKDRRVEKASERARELLGKAEEREMAFMQKLGIDPSKGKITIAPREN